MNKRIYKDTDQLCTDIFKAIDDSFINERELNFGFFTSNIKESSEVYKKLCDHFENTEDYSSTYISKREYSTLDYYYASKDNDYCVEPVLLITCIFNMFTNSINTCIQVYSHKDDFIMINPTTIFVNDILSEKFVSSLVLDRDMDKIVTYSIDPDLYEKGINYNDVKVDTKNSQHKDSFEKLNDLSKKLVVLNDDTLCKTGLQVIEDLAKVNIMDGINEIMSPSWEVKTHAFDYSKQEERSEENEMNSCPCSECSDCNEENVCTDEMVMDDLKHLSYSYIDENGEYKTVNCSTNDEDFIYYFMDYIHEILNKKHED